VVYLSPWKIGSVRIEQLTASTIHFGPCMTSVYLEGARDCTLSIACHQLRIHNCHNCRLYVKVNSHPIIEDCSEMSFAPYQLEYPSIQDDIEVKTATLFFLNSFLAIFTKLLAFNLFFHRVLD
jgi:hypothetical protein